MECDDLGYCLFANSHVPTKFVDDYYEIPPNDGYIKIVTKPLTHFLSSESTKYD